MVDIGKKTRKTDLCSTALTDNRKVPNEIWIRESKPVLEKLLSLEGEGKIKYAAFGATALGALGYTRATKDVDIVVKPLNMNFGEIAQALSADFNLTKCKNDDKVQMLVKEVGDYYFVLELWNNFIYVMDCDDEMWLRTRTGQRLGLPLTTLSVEDMIASKLGRYFFKHPQEDIYDIAFLLKEYGIKDFKYFIARIEKITREGKTIDDFLFEEILKLSELLGIEKTTELHSQIVERRPYRQLLERIMFQYSKESKDGKDLAGKTFLNKNLLEKMLKSLEIIETKKGFEIPKNPNSKITAFLAKNNATN